MALRRMWLVLAAVLAFVAGSPGAARAEVPRVTVRVERVEVEPYLAELVRLRAFVNVITMEGSLIDIAPEEMVLQAGRTRLKHIPGIGAFVDQGDLLDVVFIVEVHQSFAPALEDLGEALSKLLAKLPRATTRAALITYGEKLRPRALADPSIAAKHAKTITADDVASPPALINALKKAVNLLKGAKPLRPGAVARKLIILVSDGNDGDVQDESTMAEFRKLSRNASDAGVVIHSIAYSITDARPLLLNLGEISKKTGGTFRWARTRQDIVAHLDSVNREIRNQMVLTYFLPPDSVVGKTLAVQCRSARCGTEALTSHELKPQPLRCGDTSCGAGSACIAGSCAAVSMEGSRGGGVWLALLGVVALAGGAGAVLVKKRRGKTKGARGKRAPAGQPATGQPSTGMGAALSGQPQVGQPPGVGYGGAQVVLPDFSKIPYLANSAGVQQLQQQLANIPYVGQHMATQAALAAKAAGAPAAAPPTRGAAIYLASGPRQGQTLPLRHGFTVGRTAGCDLIIDDGMTSGHHAQFHFDTAGGVSVVDLGSTNGTFVNGVRQMNARLANGMSLRIGQTEIRFLQG